MLDRATTQVLLTCARERAQRQRGRRGRSPCANPARYSASKLLCRAPQSISNMLLRRRASAPRACLLLGLVCAAFGSVSGPLR